MKIASYLIPFLVVAVTVTSAKADLIDVIGGEVISSTSIDLFGPGNATTANGSVFFSGRTTQTGVVGGVQSYNTVTGQLSGVTAAQSLNGLGGNSGITEIIRQNDGSILYVGDSALGSNSANATYWLNDLSNPFSAQRNEGQVLFLVHQRMGLMSELTALVPLSELSVRLSSHLLVETVELP